MYKISRDSPQCARKQVVSTKGQDRIRIIGVCAVGHCTRNTNIIPVPVTMLMQMKTNITVLFNL